MQIIREKSSATSRTHVGVAHFREYMPAGRGGIRIFSPVVVVKHGADCKSQVSRVKGERYVDFTCTSTVESHSSVSDRSERSLSQPEIWFVEFSWLMEFGQDSEEAMSMQVVVIDAQMLIERFVHLFLQGKIFHQHFQRKFDWDVRPLQSQPPNLPKWLISLVSASWASMAQHPWVLLHPLEHASRRPTTEFLTICSSLTSKQASHKTDTFWQTTRKQWFLYSCVQSTV